MVSLPVSGPTSPLIGLTNMAPFLPPPLSKLTSEVDRVVKEYRDQGVTLVDIRNRLAEYLDIIDEFGFDDDNGKV